MKNNILFIILSFLSLYAVANKSEPKIDLISGTMMADGNFILDYNIKDISNSKEYDLGFKSSLGASYFIYDAWALGLGLSLDASFAPQSKGVWGLKIFSDYFFTNKSIYYPYIGGAITPGYSINASQFRLNTGLSLGVLISLSNSLALDLGIRPTLSIKMYPQQKGKFNLGIGLIGLRVSF